LYNLCVALLDAGNEAVIPAPYWVSYPDMVRLCDATPVILETGIDQNFRVSPEQLAGAINARTRLIFLNSPSNPTGASYSGAQLAALGEVIKAHPNVVVVADEIYEHIHWGDDPFVSFSNACPDLADRVVTINGVSKAYAMTGWRIGFAAGPETLIAAMNTVQSQSTSNACSVSQAAAIAALDGDQGVVAQMTAAYQQRHDFVVAALNKIPGFECRRGEGAFYAFPKVAMAIDSLGLADDVEFVEYLLNKADVALVPGSAFGAPGYVRLSFACSIETLEDALQRINRVLSA
ncbi:MAG: pyridoxal phosphate-dependent aminotransferase, partial [Woeseiaceae bacterium]